MGSFSLDPLLFDQWRLKRKLSSFRALKIKLEGQHDALQNTEEHRDRCLNDENNSFNAAKTVLATQKILLSNYADSLTATPKRIYH